MPGHFSSPFFMRVYFSSSFFMRVYLKSGREEWWQSRNASAKSEIGSKTFFYRLKNIFLSVQKRFFYRLKNIAAFKFFMKIPPLTILYSHFELNSWKHLWQSFLLLEVDFSPKWSNCSSDLICVKHFSCMPHVKYPQSCYAENPVMLKILQTQWTDGFSTTQDWDSMGWIYLWLLKR